MNILPLSNEQLEDYYQSALALLKALIRTPSFSKEEAQTGDLLSDKLEAQGIYFERKHHNLWMQNKYFHVDKPTLLLNSHHDTVKPNEGYTLNPFDPLVKEEGSCRVWEAMMRARPWSLCYILLSIFMRLICPSI